MITVETQHPIALDSYDHLYPYGTIRDNFSNSIFIKKLKEMGIQSVLDIGCAGGGFVEELLLNKIEAVGIEGSDINLRTKRAAWLTSPRNLFTADATKPFQVLKNSLPMIFDTVTCWEFFEHIEKKDLPQVMENIRTHTIDGAQLVCSITSSPSPYAGIDLHRTQEPLSFWLKLFEQHGFYRNESMERYYEGNWVRQMEHNIVLRRIQ